MLTLSAETIRQYPFRSHFLTRGRWRLHYLDEGAGPPLVMLHGNPTWSFYYRHLILALRKTHRIIVPDHIGMGLSDKPPANQYRYTLQSRIDDLDALLSALGITEDITLVVHGWGGVIGMGLAHRYPKRIKQLVVFNSTAFHLPETKRFPWQLSLYRSPLGSGLVRGLNVFCRGALQHCVTTRKLSKTTRQAYLSPYQGWRNRVAVFEFIRDIPLHPRHPSYSLLTAIEQGLTQFSQLPVLICWATKDFIFDQHFLKVWSAYFPRAEIHLCRGGHYLLEEHPERIIHLMRRFLARQSICKGDT